MEMPSDHRLSPRLVLQAWHVIRDTAEALTRITAQPTGFDAATALESALTVSRPVLAGAMGKALGKNASVIDALIDFLAYHPNTGMAKGHKGCGQLRWCPFLRPTYTRRRLPCS